MCFVYSLIRRLTGKGGTSMRPPLPRAYIHDGFIYMNVFIDQMIVVHTFYRYCSYHYLSYHYCSYHYCYYMSFIVRIVYCYSGASRLGATGAPRSSCEPGTDSQQLIGWSTNRFSNLRFRIIHYPAYWWRDFRAAAPPASPGSGAGRRMSAAPPTGRPMCMCALYHAIKDIYIYIYIFIYIYIVYI